MHRVFSRMVIQSSDDQGCDGYSFLNEDQEIQLDYSISESVVMQRKFS